VTPQIISHSVELAAEVKYFVPYFESDKKYFSNSSL